MRVVKADRRAAGEGSGDSDGGQGGGVGREAAATGGRAGPQGHGDSQRTRLGAMGHRAALGEPSSSSSSISSSSFSSTSSYSSFSSSSSSSFFSSFSSSSGDRALRHGPDMLPQPLLRASSSGFPDGLSKASEKVRACSLFLTMCGCLLAHVLFLSCRPCL